VLTRHGPQSVIPQLLDVLRRHGQRTERNRQATAPAGFCDPVGLCEPVEGEL
jgi:hypothetical protein